MRTSKTITRAVCTLFIAFLSATANAVTLKIATLSPDGSAWMQKFRAGAKEIKSETSGRVKLKFYPGGVMGDDNSVLRKIKIRQLQGGAMTGGSLARFYRDSQVYSVPLAFENLEQVTKVRKSLDTDIIAGFEEGGFVTFGIAGGGFAYIMSKQPINKPSDLLGKKVWAPNNDAATVASFDAFSISPIPLPLGDVLAGMQTGLLDTVATSPVAAVTLQWHTQIKYVTQVPLIYVYAVLAIEKKAFYKLKEDDQKVVRDVIGRIFKELDIENIESNKNALTALENQGIEIITPSPEELAQWKQLGEKASENMLQNGAISKDIFEKLSVQLNSAE